MRAKEIEKKNRLVEGAFFTVFSAILFFVPVFLILQAVPELKERGECISGAWETYGKAQPFLTLFFFILYPFMKRYLKGVDIAGVIVFLAWLFLGIFPIFLFAVSSITSPVEVWVWSFIVTSAMLFGLHLGMKEY